jgi:predicted nucleotidyltransferase
MTQADRKSLNKLAARIRERYPDARVLAFGSRVRGNNTAESDLDVCVVLDRRVSRADKDWIGDLAWDVGYPDDRIISTIVFEREAFEQGPQAVSPLVEHIRGEGIAA